MTRKLFVIVLGIGFALGCGGGADTAATPAGQPDAAGMPAAGPAAAAGWQGEVMETMDAGTYTYVRVDTGAEEIWAAAPKFQVAVGDQVGVPAGAPMKDFHSETLDRDFPLIYFVSGIMPAGADVSGAGGELPMGHPAVGAAADGSSDVDVSGIDALEGGTTVAGIFEGKDRMAGTAVALRGKVVKVNQQIMGKNWLHIQDGTGDASDGTNDLTVTTDGLAAVGDTVVIRGIVNVDKDFGAGYRYDVIVESAEVTVE